MPWYMYAFGASILWGFYYPLLGRLLSHYSLMTVQMIVAVPVLCIMPFFYRDLVKDYHYFSGLSLLEKLGVFSVPFIGTAAALMLYMAIHAKNATLASIIEISYPIFVALVSAFVLGKNQISLSALLGGSLIFIGSGIIVYFNR